MNKHVEVPQTKYTIHLRHPELIEVILNAARAEHNDVPPKGKAVKVSFKHDAEGRVDAYIKWEAPI